MPVSPASFTEAWIRAYPRDSDPHGLLTGLCAHGTGQYELSIAHVSQSIALDPAVSLAYLTKAFAHLSLGQLDEAAAAIRTGTDGEGEAHYLFHVLRYFLALVTEDAAEMQRQMEQAKGHGRDMIVGIRVHVQRNWRSR